MNNCPTCNLPALSTCRCMRGDSTCAKGHSWHQCLVHQVMVLGISDHAKPGCSCPQKPKLDQVQESVLNALKSIQAFSSDSKIIARKMNGEGITLQQMITLIEGRDPDAMSFVQDICTTATHEVVRAFGKQQKPPAPKSEPADAPVQVKLSPVVFKAPVISSTTPFAALRDYMETLKDGELISKENIEQEFQLLAGTLQRFDVKAGVSGLKQHFWMLEDMYHLTMLAYEYRWTPETESYLKLKKLISEALAHLDQLERITYRWIG